MRKTKIAIAFVFLLILAAGQANAISFVATVDDTITSGPNAGKIQVGTDIEVVIGAYNDFTGFSLGISLPIYFYSPDGLVDITHRNVAGRSIFDDRGSIQLTDSSVLELNGWDTIWTLLDEFFGFSWDGSLPDTVNNTTATFGGWNQTVDTVDYISFAFTINETGTLCVDSCEIPNTSPPAKFDWLFDDPAAFFDGPIGGYCWEVVDTTLDVKEVTRELLPTEFELGQNFPNPFNMQTKIQFALPEHSRVNITVFNVLGQKIRTIVETEFDAGYYEADWNGTSENGTVVASGLYFYKIETDKFKDTKKLILLK